jgi:hypothetical protein
MGDKAMANGTEFPSWNAEDPTESLTRVYQWAVENARKQIAWYQEKIKSKRTGSQLLRALSIILAAIGALFPLIDAAIPDGQTFLSQSGQWGYVAIGLAAAFVGYDRFFGLSSAWMRFIVTQLSLERTLKEFQYDWTILNAQSAKQSPPQRNTSTLLQRLKDFSLQMDALVRQETDVWVAEFQANISQLERMVQTEAQVRTPGSIKVTVTNARDFERVAVLLDGSPAKEMTGDTESVLSSVPPGPHQVTVLGEKNTQQRRDSKVAEVQPDTMTSVDLTLPEVS